MPELYLGNELVSEAIARDERFICTVASEIPPLAEIFDEATVTPAILLVDYGDVLSRQRPRTAIDKAGLTMREVEILGHLTHGATNDQIASALFLSRHTVKTHLYNIFRKLGVSNRLQATLWAAENLNLPQTLYTA